MTTLTVLGGRRLWAFSWASTQSSSSCSRNRHNLRFPSPRGCAGTYPRRAHATRVRGAIWRICAAASVSPRRTVTLPEMRLLITAILLAEELNFSRVAERLHIDQSTVSRRIDELEGELGYLLFNHNHQMVELKEAGRKFVEDARLGVLHIERAAQSGRAANQDADVFFTSAGRLTPIPF